MATLYERVFLGVALVALSVVFLLSGLGVFRVFGQTQFVTSQNTDILIAFFALAIGLAYVYSELSGRK